MEKPVEANKSNQRRINNILSEFEQWSIRSHIDFLPKIFETSNGALRFIWLFIFAGFSGVTAWLVIKNIIDYAQYECVSKIEIINERPSEFPTVTICDYNPLSTKAAQSLVQKKMLETYGVDLANVTYAQAEDVLSNLFALTRQYAKSEYYTSAQKKALGFRPSQIINCGLGCDPFKDLRWFFDYSYGNCYQFNSGYDNLDNKVALKLITSEGPSYGFVINIGPITNFNSYPTVMSRGLKIFIHNSSLDPTPSEEISLETGKQYNVAISKAFTSNEPYPYSECQDLTSFKSDLYTYMINANKTYRQYDCFYLCLQRLIVNACGCYHTRYAKIIQDIPPCLNLTQYYCIGTQYDSFNGDKVAQCTQDCPLECESVKYQVELSSLEYPNVERYNLFKSDEIAFNATQSKYNIDLSTYEKYKNYYLSFNLYFPYMQYTHITLSPKTSTFDLFAQIGGSLGMLYGISFLSFLEIGEILLRMGYALIFPLKWRHSSPKL